MADIFLSYAHTDKPKVRRLAAALEATGFTVWWDPNLTGGARFQKAIEAELRASKAVIVCWSKASIESHWVIDEASLGRDQQRLIPISFDKSEPPLGFRQFQTLDFSGRSGIAERMAKLVESLQTLVRPNPRTYTRTNARWFAPAVRAIAGRRLLIGLTLVASLCIGVLLLGRTSLFRQTPTSGAVAILAMNDLGGASQTSDLAKSAPRVIADLLAEYGEKVIPPDSSLALNRTSAARELNASYVVDGDVREAADKTIVLSLRLFDAAGRPLWSRGFKAQADEADYLPEQAGTLLASLLTKKDQFNTPGFVFADDSEKFRNGRVFEAYIQAKKDLAVSPNTPSLMLKVAALGGLALRDIPVEQRASLVQALRAQVTRASELDPSIDASWGIEALTPSTEWMRRSRLLAQWRAFQSPNSSALAATSLFLGQTGHPADAVPFAEQSIAARPLSSLRLSILGWSYFNAGRYEEAKDSMVKARRRWPEQSSIPQAEFMADLLLGRTSDAAALLANPRLRDEIDPPASVQPASALLRAVQYRNPANTTALATTCGDASKLSYSVLSMCLIALNLVERTDDAFKLADQMFPDLSGGTSEEREAKWLREPAIIADHGQTLFAVATAPMRRDQRFLNLLNRLNLVEYWRASGEWPDFCRTEPQSVCSRIRQH